MDHDIVCEGMSIWLPSANILMTIAYESGGRPYSWVLHSKLQSRLKRILQREVGREYIIQNGPGELQLQLRYVGDGETCTEIVNDQILRFLFQTIFQYNV